MRRRHEIGLKLATIATVTLGYLSLMTTFRYGPELAIIPLGGVLAMPIGERLDRRFKGYRYVTTASIYLYIVLFFVILGRFSLLDAVLSLVIFIQVYLLVHQKGPRQYAYILLMSFFLLWAAISETPRPDIAFVLFFYVIAVAWALTALDTFAGALAVAESGLPEALQRTKPLEPSGRRRGRVMRARFAVHLATVALGAMAAGMAVFMLGPRTEAGVFGASQARMQPATGVSSEIDLLTAGALRADTTPVMRVQFPETPDGRYNGPMLWRVTSLDTYTGVGWQHRGLVTNPPGRVGNRELFRFMSDWRLASREGVERISYADWPLIRQEIYLDRPPDTAVPALQMVRQVVPRERSENYAFRWDVAGDFSVVMSSRNDSGLYIDVLSEFINPRPADLRMASTDYSFMHPSDLATLTYQNLLPETLSLVRRVTANATNPYDRVMALVRYLSGADYRYTTIIPELPEQNPIDAFILREKQGHCELYASALALMVRSLGIPARLVTGYRDGLWDPNDRSYTVTEDMAHLWAEVYFPGQGWVSFDPSPQGDADLALMDTFSRRMSLYLLRTRMLWLRYVVGYRPPERQVLMQDTATRMFRAADEFLSGAEGDETESPLSSAGRALLLLGVPGGVAVLVVYGVWRMWGGRGRERRDSLTADQRRAVLLRQSIVRTLRGWGIVYEGKTAEELAVEVSALRVNEPAVAQAVIEAYNATRFGNRAMSKDELALWRKRLRGVRLEVGRV